MAALCAEDELLLDQVIDKEQDDLHAELGRGGGHRETRRQKGDSKAGNGGGGNDQQQILDQLAQIVPGAAEDAVPVEQEIDDAGTRSGDVGGEHDAEPRVQQENEEAVVHHKGDPRGHAVFQQRGEAGQGAVCAGGLPCVPAAFRPAFAFFF